MNLSIDLETYSSVDIKTAGHFRYIASDDFEILLFAYAFDDEPVQVVDLLCLEQIPDKVVHALFDPSVTKSAFNASFEIHSLAKYFNLSDGELNRWYGQWVCTSVWSLYAGYHHSLGTVSKVIGDANSQKDTKGTNLIKYFSCPCKPTKTNGFRERNYPHHALGKWEEYKAYNAQDVVAERALMDRLKLFPMPQQEWELWRLDQQINHRGALIDTEFVQACVDTDAGIKRDAMAELQIITDLENPNSDTQFKSWLAGNGVVTDKLDADTVAALKADHDKPLVIEALEIRAELKKTSVRKYHSMQQAQSREDNRIRGMLQFYGANRTGRWAGRIVQVHNLPRNYIDDLVYARELVKRRDLEGLRALGLPSDVLSQLIRTAIIPRDGCRFIVADFNAIEARVTSWLADEEWVLEVFRGHGLIYEETAGRMYGVPTMSVAKGGKHEDLRPLGKIAVLACGFGGGERAIASMDKAGKIPAHRYQEIVDQFRDANPNIVKLWKRLGNAAVKAVKHHTRVSVGKGIEFMYHKGAMMIRLPSGRYLVYQDVRIEPDNKFGRDVVTYLDFSSERNRWERSRTYGGKLCENIVQAIARDCLAESIDNLNMLGLDIVIHVHDEVVIEAPRGFSSGEEVCAIMGRPIEWAAALPLKAASFECEFYQKD